MEIVSQTDVEQLLRAWQQGALTERQVHDWALLRFAADAYEPESAACNAVLAELDCMDMNLLTTEDVPVLLEMLATADIDAVRSKLLSPTTIERRRLSLRTNPFYAKFCG
jgi:hypothetical protein